MIKSMKKAQKQKHKTTLRGVVDLGRSATSPGQPIFESKCGHGDREGLISYSTEGRRAFLLRLWSRQSHTHSAFRGEKFLPPAPSQIPSQSTDCVCVWVCAGLETEGCQPGIFNLKQPWLCLHTILPSSFLRSSCPAVCPSPPRPAPPPPAQPCSSEISLPALSPWSLTDLASCPLCPNLSKESDEGQGACGLVGTYDSMCVCEMQWCWEMEQLSPADKLGMLVLCPALS